MSKLKSPQEKKSKSLANDHRSTFDGSNKGNRKTLPLAKAREHRSERHSVSHALAIGNALLEIDASLHVEDATKVISAKKRKSGLTKTPDAPLGKVVATKLARRAKAPSKRA